MEKELDETRLGYEIKGAIFDAYFASGPGLLEETYKEILCHFLRKRGLSYRREVAVPVVIEGESTGSVLRIDILVENCYVLELKAVENMKDVFHAQILTYMRFGHYRHGYLVNFNTTNIKESVFPKITNKFIY